MPVAHRQYVFTVPRLLRPMFARRREWLGELCRIAARLLERAHSEACPARGPDAGAKTPGEIALVAIVAVLALLRGRCQVPANAGQVKPEAAKGAGQGSSQPKSRTAPGAAAAEGKFINPVCGMAVSTANPMHIEKYEGVS